MKMVIIYMVRFYDVESCDNLAKDFKIDPSNIFSPLGGLKVKLHKKLISLLSKSPIIKKIIFICVQC